MSSSGRAANIGGPFAVVNFIPGATATPNTNATAFADVDAANLRLPFVVPGNGKVLIRLGAWCTIPANAGGGCAMRWNLRDAGGDVAGTDREIVQSNSTTTQLDGMCFTDIVMTGLAAGQALSWKWGFASSVAAHVVQLAIGDFAGTVGKVSTVMEAWNTV